MSDMTATKLAVEIVNGSPAERILVIAPSGREFDCWCRENGINPHASNIRRVLREEDLRGYSDTWYVYLGVPNTAEGERVWRLFEHRKATRGLKNAVITAEVPGATHA